MHRPFFAKYDEKAIWLDELKPAFGEKKFFFEAPGKDDAELLETVVIQGDGLN